MNFFKRFAFNLLCNNVTGFVIHTVFRDAMPVLRWHKFRFSAPIEKVHYKQIASIFWGFYESAEIRMVEKYLNVNLDIIELGASLGIVSSHIAAKLSPGKMLLLVEANPNLIDTIHKNVARHLIKGASLTVVNRAIAYGYEQVSMVLTNNNTETRISENQLESEMAVVVKTVTIESLIAEYNIQQYGLVCDIEGAEIEILMNEMGTLKQCKQLIIELHKTSYKGKEYSVLDIAHLLMHDYQFSFVMNHGPVYLFCKP